MGLYEGIKDVAKVIQKADNIDLYQKLLDLCKQALDMQDEISRLKAENAELKKQTDLQSRIERRKELYLTLKGEDFMYCSPCWDAEKLLIQLHKREFNGSYSCPRCKQKGVYDAVIFEAKKHFNPTKHDSSW